MMRVLLGAAFAVATFTAVPARAQALTEAQLQAVQESCYPGASFPSRWWEQLVYEFGEGRSPTAEQFAQKRAEKWDQGVWSVAECMAVVVGSKIALERGGALRKAVAEQDVADKAALDANPAAFTFISGGHNPYKVTPASLGATFAKFAAYRTTVQTCGRFDTTPVYVGSGAKKLVESRQAEYRAFMASTKAHQDAGPWTYDDEQSVRSAAGHVAVFAPYLCSRKPGKNCVKDRDWQRFAEAIGDGRVARMEAALKLRGTEWAVAEDMRKAATAWNVDMNKRIQAWNASVR